MKQTIIVATDIGPCHGCGQPIAVRRQLEIEAVAEIADDGSVPFVGKIVGQAIQHDCVPKVTR